MNDADAKTIRDLLFIVHNTVGLPKLKAIHDAAEAELVDIAASYGKVPTDTDLVGKAAFVEPKSRPSTEFDASTPPVVDGEVERKV